MPLQWGVGDRMRKLRLQGEAACIYTGHSRQRQTQSGNDLGMKVGYTGIPSRWLFTIIYILSLVFFWGPFFCFSGGVVLVPMFDTNAESRTAQWNWDLLPQVGGLLRPFCRDLWHGCSSVCFASFLKKHDSCCHLSTLSMLQHVTVGVFLNMFLTFEFQRTVATCHQKSL